MDFINLERQYLEYKKEIDANIQSVLNSGHFINGNFVEQLEQRLADYVGVKHGISRK